MLYTSKQAAELLNTTHGTVGNWARTGFMKCETSTKPGASKRDLYFTMEEINRVKKIVGDTGKKPRNSSPEAVKAHMEKMRAALEAKKKAEPVIKTSPMWPKLDELSAKIESLEVKIDKMLGAWGLE